MIEIFLKSISSHGKSIEIILKSISSREKSIEMILNWFLVVWSRLKMKFTKSPDITLVREDAMLDALQSEPLDGHFATSRLVFIFVNVK